MPTILHGGPKPQPQKKFLKNFSFQGDSTGHLGSFALSVLPGQLSYLGSCHLDSCLTWTVFYLDSCRLDSCLPGQLSPVQFIIMEQFLDPEKSILEPETDP